MPSHTTVSAKWGQPHTLFYMGSFDGLPLKCQLISSLTLPAVLAGCWDATSSHFQIGVPSRLSVGRKPLLPKDPSFGNKPQPRGWALLPGCSPAAGSLEGKLLAGHPSGVWAGLVPQQSLTRDLTANLSGLLPSRPPLDDGLSSRRLSGLFLAPGFSD